jgi:shikimate kinase
MARNLAFIGMPGCGKTTVSRAAAEALRRPWFDTDAEIAAAAGMTVPEIFAARGENHFRELEAGRVAARMRGTGAVVSLGGGAPVRCAAGIKAGAVVVYITRELENIAATLEAGSRPLAQSMDNLRALYGARRGLYESLADITVGNDGALADTVKNVLEAISRYETAHP